MPAPNVIKVINPIFHEENQGETTYVTVYAPHEKQNLFLDKIQSYADEKTKSGKSKHADLVSSIADIRKALKSSLFGRTIMI